MPMRPMHSRAYARDAREKRSELHAADIAVLRAQLCMEISIRDKEARLRETAVGRGRETRKKAGKM
jgi:hypothetical protein